MHKEMKNRLKRRFEMVDPLSGPQVTSGNAPITFKVRESDRSGGKSPEVHFQKPSPYFRKLIEFEVQREWSHQSRSKSRRTKVKSSEK